MNNNNIKYERKNRKRRGAKIILFALDTEDTSVTDVITGHWSTMDGKLMYECHYKELDGTEWTIL